VPPLTVELNVVVLLIKLHIDCPPESVPADGGAVTVTVLCASLFGHPPVPATVYVIVAVPAASPVITPLVLTVATDSISLLHVPPLSGETNVVVPLVHNACVPESGPADVVAVTVTVLVTDTSAHPPVPATVYVIVAVPAATPVITPLVLTVATF
jgi:hypothetical protein